jgi:hypothetical protein
VTKADLDNVWKPLTMKWQGQDIEVKPLNFRQQRIAAKIEAGELDPFVHLSPLVHELIPSKTVEELEEAMNGEAMMMVLHIAAGKAKEVQAYLEGLAGNAVAGTAPASSPPTPSGTSSPASPAPTAVPCGT